MEADDNENERWYRSNKPLLFLKGDIVKCMLHDSPINVGETTEVVCVEGDDDYENFDWIKHSFQRPHDDERGYMIVKQKNGEPVWVHKSRFEFYALRNAKGG